MLTVPTYISHSHISGMGLFSQEFIKKGSIIWVYNPLIDLTFDETQWRQFAIQLNTFSYESLKKYSYKEKGKFILCIDNSQFMNHSEYNFNVSNSIALNTMYALNNIKKGEEILCNYKEYSDADDHHLKIIG